MERIPLPEEQPTVTIEFAARALGIGRTIAYQAARDEGEIGGVPVIKTRNRFTVPTAALRRVLRLDPEHTCNCHQLVEVAS